MLTDLKDKRVVTGPAPASRRRRDKGFAAAARR
jgi:hypothetical protein